MDYKVFTIFCPLRGQLILQYLPFMYKVFHSNSSTNQQINEVKMKMFLTWRQKYIFFVVLPEMLQAHPQSFFLRYKCQK